MLLGYYSSPVRTSLGASQSDFSVTNDAITSAFVTTRIAEAKGGNVSSLVTMLNEALALVQKAQSENSTNPSQASTDLQNATQLAEQVSSDSVGIAQSGSSANSTRTTESIGASVGIIVIAILVYIFGGRIYRRAWL